MQTNICKICRKVFISRTLSRTCNECRKLDDAYFSRVAGYLAEYPNSNAMQISEALDLPIELVVSYITEGRLITSPGTFEKIKDDE